jgi:hypothetical protein
MSIIKLNNLIKKSLKENENDIPASPDEKSMAMNQLNFIKYAASEIEEYLESGVDGFPEWLQNKLTTVHSKIKDIHSYIEGERRDEGVHSFAAMNATKAALKRKKKEGVNEAGLKGIENIPANKKLSQLSDNDKLKIVQGAGNLISFKIPSWSKDKKWTVISSGKIVKKKDFDGDTIFFLQGKGPVKTSPTYSSVKELLDGVEWDTMELRREFD